MLPPRVVKNLAPRVNHVTHRHTSVNVADELAKLGGTSFVDLEYEKAWGDAERLNRDIPLPW
jgi:hypothetical protein